jgi:hypothetical protein
LMALNKLSRSDELRNFIPIERFNCWVGLAFCTRRACWMRGTVCPLKSVREFWFARTATLIARRLTAINIREATTKDTFLTKLRCILLHSVWMTQKSSFDPRIIYTKTLSNKNTFKCLLSLTEIQVKRLMPVILPYITGKNNPVEMNVKMGRVRYWVLYYYRRLKALSTAFIVASSIFVFIATQKNVVRHNHLLISEMATRLLQR